MKQVFSVGLPRTGNQSVQKALEILGYKNVRQDPQKIEMLPALEAAVEIRYSLKEIKSICPNALFVLTIRDDLDVWLASCKRVFPAVPRDWNPFWFKSDWLKAYNDRLEEAKMEQCLIFNVKQGWQPLCGFLGLSMPNMPFPNVDYHRNRKYVSFL